MFRPFMIAPATVRQRSGLALTDANVLKLWQDQPQTQQDLPSKFLQLPGHILDAIFDQLEVLDRCTLALTSKQLLIYAQQNEHLNYIMTSPPSLGSLQTFFQKQLGAGWIPHGLRYCPDCGRFVSTDQLHWRHISEKYTREHTGRISQLWRHRREDGWLRYWIERWCQDSQDVDNTARALSMEDTTQLLCPKCAIQNPETNMWRTKRLAARNYRHRGRTRLVSPGLKSSRETALVSRYNEVPAWI